MKEKKLTDEEIVKAFDCCYNLSLYCDECPCDGWGCDVTPNDIIILIDRQKAEIERLTEEKEDWENSCHMWSEANKKNHLKFTKTLEKLCEERNKNAELQKQVDELKAKQVIECYGMLEGCDMVQQAVKDTAKEILQMLYDDRNGYWDSCDCGKDETYWRDNSIQGTLNEIKERYGLEVE